MCSSDLGRDAIEQIGVEGVSDMLYAGMHYPDATTREQ